MDNIIICGMGAAGFAALTAIRRTNHSAQVTIIDPKNNDIYHPCALPLGIEGLVSLNELTEDLPPMASTKKIRGYVTGIDPESRVVTVSRGDKWEKIEYQALIITTGSKAIIPHLDGIGTMMGKRLYTLKSVQDMEMIKRSMKGASSAVVIGGGAIGCECAAVLRSHIGKVTLVEMNNHLLDGILDHDMEKILHHHLSEAGIDIMTGTTVTSILGKNRCQGIGTGSGEIESDLVIMATGVVPDLSLASTPDGEDSILDHDSNGIWVDTRLCTSSEKIFAAGDCISQWSVVDGNHVRSALATCAYKQGIVAGTNAAGGSLQYMGTAGTFVTSISGLEVAGTGYTSELAQQMGFNPVSGMITCAIRPSYMPDPGSITVKVIYDRDTDRILGAQAIGMEGAAARINVISAAIEFSIPASQVGRIEMAYCPRVSDVHDPLMRAHEFAMKRGEKKGTQTRSRSFN